MSRYEHLEGMFTHIAPNGRWCHSKPERTENWGANKNCEVCEIELEEVGCVCREEVLPDIEYPDDTREPYECYYNTHLVCSDCYETMMKCGQYYYYYAISSETYHGWIEKIRIPDIKEPVDYEDE